MVISRGRCYTLILTSNIRYEKKNAPFLIRRSRRAKAKKKKAAVRQTQLDGWREGNRRRLEGNQCGWVSTDGGGRVTDGRRRVTEGHLTVTEAVPDHGP